MARVAVITRTKDRSLFLARAIESVKSQTYKDYVHVIVNDGGDKGEVERVIETLDTKIKSRIKLFHRPCASNAPDTIFNESIDRVDSDYIVIHDDDDTWHEDFLAKTVEHLNANEDLAGVVVRTDKIIEKDEGVAIKTLGRQPWMPDMQIISLYRQYIDNQLTPISFLFRRDAYQSVGKFDANLPIVGDWEFGIRLLQRYDVDFLDPGFALANYHHRKTTKDNSFAKHSHRKYVTKVANAYLRKDLESGHLGVGYMISDLKYRQDSAHSLIKRVVPTRVLRVIQRRK